MAKEKIALADIPGFSVTAVKAGIKKSGKLDLGLIVADGPAAAAGVFTQSKVCAAPVQVTRKHLRASGGTARAILVNAGNANACTGAQGLRGAEACAARLAGALGFSAREALVCSTGVIGHQLDLDKMLSGVDACVARLGRGGSGDFVKAIMTTDLAPKSAGCRAAKPCGALVAGVCKGSGMIAPNMATMLAFILTDANIAPAPLQAALRDAAQATFNAVTVDGDTSTNDTALALASCRAKHPRIAKASGPAYAAFAAALHRICLSLAEQIARDGEGATKLVRVAVEGARSVADARRAARTIAESPLVKTAMFGNDPNWGRIIAAAGRSGAAMEEAKTRIELCGVTLFKDGSPLPFNAAAVSKKMKAKEIEVRVDLGVGRESFAMLTCDYSYDYIRINAEYHT